MVKERCKWWSVRTLTILALALGFSVAVHGAPRYQVLHSFNGKDGAGPYGGVTLDRRGNLYGTTAGGGPCGTVFRLTPHANHQWKESILYQFAADHDGCGPLSSVVFDPSGNLYATTSGGGTYHAGTVFELTHRPSGWTEAVLYSFGTQSNDGGEPTAGLVMDAQGNLYGTTPNGSPYSTVFRLTPTQEGWKETVLYKFCSPSPICRDGTAPYAGVILDTAGNLYGTTSYGGMGCIGEGCGTVYELSQLSGGSWKETVLHRFNNDGKDGVTPGNGALFMDNSGSLYGTTAAGGANFCRHAGAFANGWGVDNAVAKR